MRECILRDEPGLGTLPRIDTRTVALPNGSLTLQIKLLRAVGDSTSRRVLEVSCLLILEISGELLLQAGTVQGIHAQMMLIHSQLMLILAHLLLHGDRLLELLLLLRHRHLPAGRHL